jgi:hypothetical protein
MLAWCARFHLRAECLLQGRRLTLQLRTGDPVFPGSAPRPYDSAIEERFAREFRKLAPGWDIVREPEPINAAGTLIFPDFAIQCRGDPGRRWLLEIVGYWTPDYIARKLARYHSAQPLNLILCIDEQRNCASADLPRTPASFGSGGAWIRQRSCGRSVFEDAPRMFSRTRSSATGSSSTWHPAVRKGSRRGFVHAPARHQGRSYANGHLHGQDALPLQARPLRSWWCLSLRWSRCAGSIGVVWHLACWQARCEVIGSAELSLDRGQPRHDWQAAAMPAAPEPLRIEAGSERRASTPAGHSGVAAVREPKA